MGSTLKKYALAILAFLMAPVAAFAAIPAEVSTALADLKVDAVTMAGIVLVAIIAVFAVKFLRRGV